MSKFYNFLSNYFLIATIAICPFISENAYSQAILVEATLPINVEWSEGSIITNDGVELTGLLKYNDKNEQVSYEDGNDSRSFNARNVAGFEFYDERIGKQRVFYSLSYEDAQNNVKRPFFFEVIKEFEDFAVVSKVDRIEIDHKKRISDPYTENFTRGTNYGTRTEISQTEIIYLMDTKVNIRPYVKLVGSDVDDLFYNTSKTNDKMMDKNLLEEYIGSNNHQILVSYAKQNNLSFKRKSDLIKILEYYSELLNR